MSMVSRVGANSDSSEAADEIKTTASSLWNFEVDAKRPSEEALKRWRSAAICLNANRRFRMVANLDQCAEAERKRPKILGNPRYDWVLLCMQWKAGKTKLSSDECDEVEGVNQMTGPEADGYGGSNTDGASTSSTIGGDPNPEPILRPCITEHGNNISGVSRSEDGSPYNAGEHIIDVPEEDMDGTENNINVPAEITPGGGSMKNETLLTVAAQTVAGLLANRIASSDASSTHFVVMALVLGLSFEVGGAALQGNKGLRKLSIWMTKIGHVCIASAAILSMAMHLPPVMAWIAAPLAFLIMAPALPIA